ncbi:MAG: CRISPR-associated protein Csx16 [Rubrivivax sp.]|nr:CRISPR-associated protein Csx16 [Rubrivivax sp.]
MRTLDTRVFLVTRHHGAQDWLRLRLRGLQPILKTHLDDLDEIRPGDMVCGVLPLSLAATLCRHGVVVICIDVDVPEALRGQELDACTLDRLGARLTRYEVSACPWTEGNQA